MFKLCTYMLLFSGFLACFAQNPLDTPVIDQGVRDLFKKAHKQNISQYKDRTRYFLRTGVVADKQSREVRILAVATGNGEGTVLEYVLVGENGKHYESLASTLAKPSDIHEAMEFVGLQAGNTVRPSAHYLWSKGDAVDISVTWSRDGKPITAPIAKLLKSSEPEDRTISEGWIFTGAYHYEKQGKTVYVADEAGDIISTFNSSWTVFDVAVEAGQKEVYGIIFPSALFKPKFQESIEFIIKPTLPVGQSRNVDMKLELLNPEAGPAKTGDDIVFSLSMIGSRNLLKSGTLKDTLTQITPFLKDGKRVYLKLHYSPDISIGAMAGVVPVINEITSRSYIRIEPVDGQIFYRAFSPQDSWRDPKARPGQPLEIFFPESAGAPYGFRYYNEDFLPTGTLKLSELRKEFSTEAELTAILKTKEDWLTQTALFYAAAETPVSDIAQLYRHIQDSYPIIFVFANSK